MTYAVLYNGFTNHDKHPPVLVSNKCLSITIDKSISMSNRVNPFSRHVSLYAVLWLPEMQYSLCSSIRCISLLRSISRTVPAHDLCAHNWMIIVIGFCNIIESCFTSIVIYLWYLYTLFHILNFAKNMNNTRGGAVDYVFGTIDVNRKYLISSIDSGLYFNAIYRKNKYWNATMHPPNIT